MTTTQTTTPIKGAPRMGARERLLQTANRLFYEEGIHTVGIDRILAESGVAKASLYNTFGSKEALVAAYLEGRHERQKARIGRALEKATTPRQRILAVFDAQAELYAQPGFRGCAFAAATAEGPSGTPIEEQSRRYRDYVRDLFRDFAREGGAADPDKLACELHVVYDGTQQSARMEHDAAIAGSARTIVVLLLDNAGVVDN